jgi:hypothetical protein
VWGGGFKSLAGGPSACCSGSYVSSFRLFRCGRGWTTPIHVWGKRRRHDFGDLAKERPWEAVLGRARESRAPRFVLPKRVWTVSTLMSALLERCQDLCPMSGWAINLSITVPEKWFLEHNVTAIWGGLVR